MNLLVRLWRNNITATFLAGLVLLLPVVLTIIIMAWLIDMLRAALGPGTVLGRLLTTGGTTIIGPGYDTLAFLLGIFIALIGIWFLGMVARSAAQQSIESGIDKIFTRMPVIRTIYNPVSRMVRLAMATDKQAGDFSGMTVVSCRFGGQDGVDVLALLANPHTYYIGDQPRMLVYLPSAPFLMTGGLVLVARDAVIPVPEMKVDDLLRVYVSLGALAPDSLKRNLKGPQEPLKTSLIPPGLDPKASDLILAKDAAE
jgi:uncharacterized membrane protein